MDVTQFGLVIALAVVLCDHYRSERWHRSADSFSVKLKLLHLAAGLHHPGLLCRWMGDRSLPFLDGRLLSPDERGGDRWWLVPGSSIDMDAVSSHSFRAGCLSHFSTSPMQPPGQRKDRPQ